MDAKSINEVLMSRIKDAEIDGAIVGQVVNGVGRDLWSLVDVAQVRSAASRALHYEVAVRYEHSVVAEAKTGRADVFDAALATSVAEVTPEAMRAEVLTKARSLVGIEGEKE